MVYIKRVLLFSISLGLFLAVIAGEKDKPLVRTSSWSESIDEFKTELRFLGHVSGLMPCKKTAKFRFYEAKTREFLKLLGCFNVESEFLSILPLQGFEYCLGHYITVSYATSQRIVLDIVDKKIGYMLFTCAHEAAHWARGHTNPYTRIRYGNSFAREKDADITAARMLCANGYRWVVQDWVDGIQNAHIKGPIAGEFWMEHYDGIHPSYKEAYEYLCVVLREHDEQVTAKSLPDNYKTVSREAITQELKAIEENTTLDSFDILRQKIACTVSATAVCGLLYYKILYKAKKKPGYYSL